MLTRMLKSALFDDSRTYRYLLVRTWDTDKGTAVFIMLNPSTADAEQDDPTIRRCIQIATAWNFGRIKVVNLYAYRSTDPKQLQFAVDPIGPENDRHILEATAGEFIIAAWGNNAGTERAVRVRRLLSGYSLNCLGLNKSGQPKHPLYAKTNALAHWDAINEETP